MSESLYERVGGQPVIDDAVEQFYGRVFGDPALRPFFEHVAKEKLLTMQKEFFAAALDGPVAYGGTGLREAHAGLGITPADLARFTEHLLDTLTAVGLSRDDAEQVLDRIGRYADDVVGGSAEAG